MPISLLSPAAEYTHQPLAEHSPQVVNTKSTEITDMTPLQIDGVHYNSRGYEICGQLNQHSKPCQRIGSCPFHKKDFGKPTAPSDGNSVYLTKPPIKRGPYKRGWTKEEHMLFLNGLQIHGKGAWKEISMIVQTRTPTQIQSHAQKYFLRQKQEVKNKRSIHDISLEDITIGNGAHEVNRVPIHAKNPVSLSMRTPNFVYPAMLTGFQQDPLFINSLGQSIIGNGFSVPYGAGSWLPQIYPFSMSMGLPSPNIHEDRIGMELHGPTEDTSINEQVLVKQQPEDYTPENIGEKRSYDSFSFHTYPNTLHDDNDNRATKIMKVSENDFLFHH